MMEMPVKSSSDQMGMKKTLGKRKIEKMEKIENPQARMVTFSKRRKGLFRKADALYSLSGSEIAFIIRSRAGRFYTHGSPCFDSIMDKFGESSVSEFCESSSSPTSGLTSDGELDGLKFWTELNVEEINDVEEVKEAVKKMEELKENLERRTELYFDFSDLDKLSGFYELMDQV